MPSGLKHLTRFLKVSDPAGPAGTLRSASALEAFIEQLVTLTLVVAVPPIEGPGAPIILAELQLQANAAGTREVAFGNIEQRGPHAVGACRGGHEELVDFGN